MAKQGTTETKHFEIRNGFGIIQLLHVRADTKWHYVGNDGTGPKIYYRKASGDESIVYSNNNLNKHITDNANCIGVVGSLTFQQLLEVRKYLTMEETNYQTPQELISQIFDISVEEVNTKLLVVTPVVYGFSES